MSHQISYAYAAEGGTTLLRSAYSLDPTGNSIRVAEVRAPLVGTTTYRYDALNRLKTVAGHGLRLRRRRLSRWQKGERRHHPLRLGSASAGWAGCGDP